MVLVALLVLASGCSGLVGGGDQPTSDADGVAPTGTATPVPVPTDRPDVPPGVDADTGVVTDPTALAAANHRALDATAHRLTRTIQLAGGTDTLVIDRQQRRGPDGRVLASLTVTGEGPVRPAVDARTRYRESDIVHERARLPDGRTVTNRVPASTNASLLFGSQLPRRLLTAGRFVVTGRTTEGVVLRSQGTLELPGGITPLSTATASVTVRAVVARTGLVRSLTVDAVAETPNGRYPVRITQTVTTDPVTVDRPAWVDDGPGQRRVRA